MAIKDPYVRSKQKRYQTAEEKRKAHIEANRKYRKRNKLELKLRRLKRNATRQEAEQMELIPAKKKGKCTCGNVKRCSECRRRAQAEERKNSDEKQHAPEYLTRIISPDVLAICLEVRARNSKTAVAAG